MTLLALTEALRQGRGLLLKRDIQPFARAFPHAPSSPRLGPRSGEPIRNGDDAAAIPDGDGHLLLAAEGMLPGFVAAAPWFAGYCAILVNASDIAAMGGRPYAVVDVIFAGDGLDLEQLLAGMRVASEQLAIPVVGGHTSHVAGETALAVAIVGRARSLITSFDAHPEQDLLLAIDLRGAYHGRGNNFDAATEAPAEGLRAQLEVLPEIAEAGLVRAGKDVSMAGIPGTLVMLAESSGGCAVLDLDAISRPADVPLERWLQTFPSFGYLLAADRDHTPEIIARFDAVGVACARVGRFCAERAVSLTLGGEQSIFWDLQQAPLTSFSNEA